MALSCSYACQRLKIKKKQTNRFSVEERTGKEGRKQENKEEVGWICREEENGRQQRKYAADLGKGTKCVSCKKAKHRT